MADPWHESVLGRDDAEYPLRGFDEVGRAASTLADQCVRELRVLTPDLESRVYDNDAFVEAAKRLALSSRFARLRFLVVDSGPAVRSGHRLITLARKLTTFIAVRRVGPASRDGTIDAFLLADDRGLLYRSLGDRPDGTVCFNAPLAARVQAARFDELWAESQTDPDMRRLHL